jgi:hypothetical protein
MTCPKCNAPHVVKPVPGALKFPQRLECPVHGWLPERITPIRMRFHKDRPDGRACWRESVHWHTKAEIRRRMKS